MAFLRSCRAGAHVTGCDQQLTPPSHGENPVCNGFVTRCRGSWRHAQYRGQARQLPGVPRPGMEVPPLPAGLDGRDADPGPGRVRAPVVHGMRRLGTGPGPGWLMTGGTAGTPRTDDEVAGAAGPERPDGRGLALAGWSALNAAPDVPPWMRAELVRLQAAFPEFSFGICPGWRGLMFEAWRDPSTGGVYAVITGDVGELWRELAGTRSGGTRQVADEYGKDAR